MPDNLTTVDVNVNLKYPCKQHKDVESYQERKVYQPLPLWLLQAVDGDQSYTK
jgi:hypothetical protein